MLFIYGGGFIEGYSERVNYGPEHLMEHDVILVTINYRVGPFGELSLETTFGNISYSKSLKCQYFVANSEKLTSEI